MTTDTQQQLRVDFAALKKMSDAVVELRRQYEHLATLAYNASRQARTGRRQALLEQHNLVALALSKLDACAACARAITAYLEACNVPAELPFMPDHERFMLLHLTGRVQWADEHFEVAVARSKAQPSQGVIAVKDLASGNVERARFAWGDCSAYQSTHLDLILVHMQAAADPAEHAFAAACVELDC